MTNRDETNEGQPTSGNEASAAAGTDADAAAGATSTDTAAPVDPLEQALAEAAQFRDRMLRTAADFDNFRKRSRREMEDASRKGRDGLLRELLPVFDNLERAMAHAGTTESDPEADWKGLSDGLGLVIRQFRDTLGRLGIERVESVGTPFDPSIHEAIQHLETTEHPPGHVAAEAQAAYREGERLVRPALVVVAKAPAPSGGSSTGGDSSSENGASSSG